MANIATRIKIKFGLRQEPTAAQIYRWYELTSTFVGIGMSEDRAGEKAAHQLFPDYGSTYYASEADTISYLLDQIGSNRPK